MARAIVQSVVERPVNDTETLQASGQTILCRLPENIREMTLDGLTQALWMGHSETEASHLSTWATMAYDKLKLMELAPDDLHRRIRERIDHALENGRKRGWSRTPLAEALASAAASPDTLEDINHAALGDSAELNFQQKNGMGEIRALKRILGCEPKSDTQTGGYLAGLLTAAELAHLVGAGELADEAVTHLARCSRHEELRNTASLRKDDALLVKIGLMAMDDYLNARNRYSVGYANQAIDALMRVRGVDRDVARGILRDIAELVTDDAVIARAIEHESTYHPNARSSADGIRVAMFDTAFRALRATGETVKVIPTDSINTQWVTRIDDTDTRDLIVKLAGIARERLPRFESEQMYAALAACEETAILDEDADRLLKYPVPGDTHRHGHFKAAKLYAASGNWEGLVRAIGTIEEDGYELDDFSRRMLCQRMEFGLESFRYYPPEFEREGFPRYDTRGVSIRDAEKAQIEEEVNIVGRVRRIREALAPEVAQERKESALANIGTGNLWAAWNAYFEALDQEGILKCARMMLENNDGMRALTPLMFAAVLRELEEDGHGW